MPDISPALDIRSRSHPTGTGPVSRRAPVRVLVIEDHTLFAESLELVLQLEGYAVERMAVPPQRVPAQALVSKALRARASIVLLDLSLGGFGDSTALIRPLAAAGAHVVVVTASTNRAQWGECLYLGARTVLSKGGPLSGILSTVRRITNGFPVLPVAEREAMIDLWREARAEHAAQHERLNLLTHREAVVLGELMFGKTVSDIARESVVSEATVRTQVKAILAKLGVSSQLAAVGLANQAGWRAPQTRLLGTA
ncbi:Transcriptional regulatory protein DesR [Nocardioides sp. T2.26MG-1]|nr:Transcriptional regulatory protein DesR [Nocardioides sp. T2.26MG-1]